jgi:hypothetical protein
VDYDDLVLVSTEAICSLEDFEEQLADAQKKLWDDCAQHLVPAPYTQRYPQLLEALQQLWAKDSWAEAPGPGPLQR